MRRKARFYGIRWKLFFCLTAVTVGLLGITALAVNLVMRHYLEEAALEKYTFSSRFLELELEESFSELETETESFIFDAVIQRTLDSEPLTLLEQNTLSNVWNRISSKYVRNGVYLDNKGNVYIKGNRAFSFPYQEYEESELPKAKERSYGKLQWVWMQDTIFGTGEESIFLIRNVRSVENPDQSGILLLQLSNYFMDYALEQAGSSDQLSYYLFDGNRQLCYERSSSERSSDDRDRHTEEIVNMIDCIEEEGTRIVGINGGIIFSDY